MKMVDTINLLYISITIEESHMNVCDDESNDEDGDPDSKHVQCPLLWVGAHTVAIEDEVLADAGEAVDPGPGEGDHDGQEDARDHRDKDQDRLVAR